MTSLAFLPQMVIVLGLRYPDEKCLLKVKEDILDWLNIIFFTNIKLLFMHVLSIGSLYKEYFLLKHEDSPVPHANCSSRPTHTSIAYGVQVDDEPCDGFKDFLDIFNRAKCSEFSCNKLLRVNRFIITRKCTRRRCHIPLPSLQTEAFVGSFLRPCVT